MQNDIDLHKKNWLLIADGEPLPQQKLRKLAENRCVVVLDGAYKIAKASDLEMHALLGDFDSIDPLHLKEAEQYTRVIHTLDQNKSDLEKGLQYIDALHPKSIVIAAATGGRLQHTLHNLRVLKRYHLPQRSLIMFSETERISYHENSSVSLTGKIGDAVAVLGFPNGSASSVGLKYEMQNYPLHFELSSSTSNALAAIDAKIDIEGAALVIFENFFLPP